eukprot:scaffold123245_cov32-Tisochrysis_lutea.AAC.4
MHTRAARDEYSMCGGLAYLGAKEHSKCCGRNMYATARGARDCAAVDASRSREHHQCIPILTAFCFSTGVRSRHPIRLLARSTTSFSVAFVARLAHDSQSNEPHRELMYDRLPCVRTRSRIIDDARSRKGHVPLFSRSQRRGWSSGIAVARTKT